MPPMPSQGIVNRKFAIVNIPSTEMQYELHDVPITQAPDVSKPTHLCH